MAGAQNPSRGNEGRATESFLCVVLVAQANHPIVRACVQGGETFFFFATHFSVFFLLFAAQTNHSLRARAFDVRVLKGECGWMGARTHACARTNICSTVRARGRAEGDGA